MFDFFQSRRLSVPLWKFKPQRGIENFLILGQTLRQRKMVVAIRLRKDKLKTRYTYACLCQKASASGEYLLCIPTPNEKKTETSYLSPPVPRRNSHLPRRVTGSVIPANHTPTARI